MKKTLVLTHEYYPFKGGVARYVYNLFKDYNKDDYLVLTDHKEVKSHDNIINTRLRWPLVKPSWGLSILKLKKIIKENSIEQIFTPNILPLGSVAYFLKIPYIISLHGLDINLALKNKPELTKKILHNAKHIIVNSQSTALSLKGLDLDEKKISLIYPSVDLVDKYDTRVLEAFRKKLDIKDGEKILLTVGRLVKRKGHDLVIDAISQLKDEYNIKYFIVGSGPEKDNIKKLIKEKNLNKKVFLFENIKDQEKIYFYKMSDVFVMPHRSEEGDIEGLGIVYLEAANMHIPIICGARGGVTEIFSPDDVLMVENADVRQLNRHLRYLLKNKKEADKLSDRAYQIIQNFNNVSRKSDILKQILQ
ncbi:glycosyltransferase family 4 protein [Patescibacteria group bacterium]|nr:glycosyltransferase family 4 protein [Patescibacteria group bacterium]